MGRFESSCSALSDAAKDARAGLLRLWRAEGRKMKRRELDALDRAILRALLENGRLTQVELAEIVPLSPTAIARRMRSLEEDGVITGYAARIDREVLGLNIKVIVRVSLRNQNEELLSAFEKAVAASPSIVSCYLMSGEDDYVLTVLAKDLADYERVHKEQLSRLPGIARLTSSFAMREVSKKTPVELLRA
jgi:DNA-binding Lrp family transcriptional regulator